MKHFLFSIQDTVAQTMAAPFMFQNINLAKRALRDLVNDETSRVSKNPEDYQLYLLGEFDDETGILVAGVPTPLCSARSLME